MIKVHPHHHLQQEIKDISFDGLTGRISFDEQGRRRNFTLDVMEMTVSIFIPNLSIMIIMINELGNEIIVMCETQIVSTVFDLL